MKRTWTIIGVSDVAKSFKWAVRVLEAARSVTSEIAVGAIVAAPLFVGLAAHGLCIRFGLLRSVAVPINTSLFGANKTYRGLTAVALSLVGYWLGMRRTPH